MAKAMRKELHDVDFITLEELNIMLEKMLKEGGVVSIAGFGYSFKPQEYLKYGNLLAKKSYHPFFIELETPNGNIKITEDDMLIIGIDCRPYVMSKRIFEMTFKVIEEIEKGELK